MHKTSIRIYNIKTCICAQNISAADSIDDSNIDNEKVKQSDALLKAISVALGMRNIFDVKIVILIRVTSNKDGRIMQNKTTVKDKNSYLNFQIDEKFFPGYGKLFFF